MSIVALWLLTVGVADLVRWSADRAGLLRTVIGFVAGAIVAGATVLLLGFPAGATVLWTAIVTVGVAGWFWTSDRALVRSKGSGWPLALMLAYLAGLLALTGTAPTETGVAHDWYGDLQIPALEGLPFDNFLLGLGALIFLQCTANRITRLILIGAGTPAAQGESKLRGGRIIGDRVFPYRQPGKLATGDRADRASLDASGALTKVDLEPAVHDVRRPGDVIGV